MMPKNDTKQIVYRLEKGKSKTLIVNNALNGVEYDSFLYYLFKGFENDRY